MKTAQDFLKEANEIVEKIDTLDAIKKHGSDTTIFIDVRDSGDIQKTGTIKDALTIPRGFIEFAADDQTPYFNTKLNKNSEIILVCGAGGQAALSGKTLIEMGYSNVKNVGGIGDGDAASDESARRRATITRGSRRRRRRRAPTAAP